MSSLSQNMVPVAQPDQRRGFDERQSCLAGLYLLTAEGALACFDSGGRLIMEPEPSEALSFRLQALLNQYRSGAVEHLGIGLIVGTELEQQWATGTMILSEAVLNELFDSGSGPQPPLTDCEQRHKSSTVGRAMELVLNKNRPSEGQVPRFCPVLFVPEVNGDMLCERYQVDLVDSRGVFEVLDLYAPFASNSRPPDELLRMVRRMRRAQFRVGAGSRSGREPRGFAAAGGHARWEAPGAALSMQQERSRDFLPTAVSGGGDTCFKKGDPVTGWLLEWFSPFNELTDTQRDIIAGYETIRQARAGEILVERGSAEDICIYLVEGVLALEGPGGSIMNVVGGTRRSRLPISVLAPHVYTVTAFTDVSIIVFSQKLIRKINEIARTYSSVGCDSGPEWSTTAISNGVQAAYLHCASLDPLDDG